MELKGFKSFADKTVVDFQTGITGIVGPNGSGKSNISDAIRWVLGEQSAKSLRGSKMEDIIFNGTDKRKAVNYAEISMILDNTDGKFPLEYREVIVTRRVFRTGESEYYINKTACRLKDIKELFMDTGIGAEGYSIIGQGKIDEILSSKAEDRRHLFEEAVGIVKYKTRKQHAERKLDRTNDNLIRIKDIVLELEKQVGPLEKQAKKAQRYLEIKEELQADEFKFYGIENQRMIGEIEACEKKLEKTLAELATHEEKIHENNNQIEVKTAEMKALGAELEEIQEKIFEIKNEIEKTEGLINLLNEKNSTLSRDAIRIKSEIEVSLHKNADVEAELKEEEAIYEEHRTTAKSLDTEISALAQRIKDIQLNNGLATQSIQDKQTKHIQLLNEISELKSKKSSLTAFVTNLESRIVELKDTAQNVEQEALDITEKSASIADEIKAREVKREEAIKCYNQLAEKGKNAQVDLKHKNQLIFELEKQLGIQLSKKKMLEDMQNSYEGFYNSVKLTLKAVQEHSELKNGFEGVFAELIKVPADYEIAVEMALGATAQNIVTATEYSAKNILNYIKKHQLGRVTFMPMDAVKGTEVNVEQLGIKKQAGFIDIASHLITFDSRYKEIIDYALGRVFVFDRIENAIEGAKRTGHKYKIITLDGEVLNPGGTITGGSVNKKAPKLLSRTREIEDLGLKIEQDKTQLNQLKEEIRQIEAVIKALETEVLEEKEKIDQVNAELNDKRYQAKSIALALEQNREKNTRNIDELRRLEDEIAQNHFKIEEVERFSKEKVTQTESILEEIKELREQNASDDEALKQLEVKLTSLKIQEAAIKEKGESVQNSIRTKRSFIENFERELKGKELLITQINDEKNQNEIKIVESTKAKENFKQQAEGLENDLLSKKEQKELLNQTIEQSEKLKLEQEHEMDGLKELKSKYLIEKEKFVFKMDSLKEKLLEDYGMSLDTLEMDIDLELDIQALNQNIITLKNRIKALGNVNVDAIEEFAQVRERYDFLLGQQVDLEEAKTSLEKVIKEMEVQMEVLFRENFAIIKQNFEDIFVKLFGGGKADIKLTDEEDLLNAGIEIIAQPPGKKLQSILLLSGGEKALTAIALLFAILKMKPSPFCVLDEIEAALDDANVDRFANYLKNYSATTQFIVITHRKGTMEAVDSLYGVTMEEKGVSKIVSVKLSEDNINQFIQ